MPAELWSSIILTFGGIGFALVALFAARSAFKTALEGPAIRGRLAELEARSEQHTREIAEAIGAAEKARRIASKRETKAIRDLGGVRRAAVPPGNGESRRARQRDIFDAPPGERFAPEPEERTDDQELEALGDSVEELD